MKELLIMLAIYIGGIYINYSFLSILFRGKEKEETIKEIGPFISVFWPLLLVALIFYIPILIINKIIYGKGKNFL